MPTGDVQLQGVTINAGILETLQGFSTNRNVLKGVTIGVGTGASIMQMKVVDKNHEPIEGATCRVLNATEGYDPNRNVLYIDTVDDYLRVAGSGLPIAANANFVFEMYLKVMQWGTGNPGLWRSGTSFNIFQGTTGRPWVRWNGTDILRPSTGYQLPLNEWHKIKYEIISGSVVNFYVDDELKHTANHTRPTAAFNIIDFGYQGTIAERVSGQYSNIEIKENGTTKMKWPIKEGSGTTLSDVSGNSYNGTVFGATWQTASDLLIPDGSIGGYEATPYDSHTTNASGLCTLNYQINNIHGLEVTLPGKRRFIMPFQRTTRGLLDWQVMLSDYLATFATDKGNILINSEPENNDANFLIE